jgi:hypothetical protein
MIQPISLIFGGSLVHVSGLEYLKLRNVANMAKTRGCIRVEQLEGTCPLLAAGLRQSCTGGQFLKACLASRRCRAKQGRKWEIICRDVRCAQDFGAGSRPQRRLSLTILLAKFTVS